MRRCPGLPLAGSVPGPLPRRPAGPEPDLDRPPPHRARRGCRGGLPAPQLGPVPRSQARQRGVRREGTSKDLRLRPGQEAPSRRPRGGRPVQPHWQHRQPQVHGPRGGSGPPVQPQGRRVLVRDRALADLRPGHPVRWLHPGDALGLGNRPGPPTQALGRLAGPLDGPDAEVLVGPDRFQA